MNFFLIDKLLKVTAKSKCNNNTLDMYYMILDHDLASRWIELIDYSNSKGYTTTSNYRKKRSAEESVELFKEFKDIVDFINVYYDKQLFLPEYNKLDDDQLNLLHEEFEIYGGRVDKLLSVDFWGDPDKHPEYKNNVWPVSQFNEALHSNFLRLNELIHIFQTIIKRTPTDPLRICTVDFDPKGLHKPLKSEDYLLFTIEKFWGWIYLGYNTLGKPWLPASVDNDVDVAKEKRIVPQTRFAAEFQMYFGIPAPCEYASRSYFYNWWLKNNISEVIDPNMLLKEIALGAAPLAKFVTYKINNDIVISPTNNIEWNNQVWDNFDYISSAEIVSEANEIKLILTGVV